MSKINDASVVKQTICYANFQSHSEIESARLFEVGGEMLWI